jgi:hypothetical protein
VIGGRSGVGKSAVAAEIHQQLIRYDVRHGLIEGDVLDLAHPPPWEHALAERNLAAIAENYRRLGYHRLVYSNTVSVLESESLVRAVGGEVRVVGVLLAATDETVRGRLARREIGSGLDWHVERSIAMDERLQTGAPGWVHRLPTDDRSVQEVAGKVLALTGWT